MSFAEALDHELWMRRALAEAERAAEIGEVPIGCVIVHAPTQTLMAAAHNRREIDHDPTAHAEILALRVAAARIGHWRVLECALYVTLEPCPMCAGAIVNARVPLLVYGCDDPKAGAVRTLYQIVSDLRLNHRTEIIGPYLADPCAAVLKAFFQKQRAENREKRTAPK